MGQTVVGDAAIGDTVSFQVYPSSILGTPFTGVKIMAVLDADTVKFFGVDPEAMHVNVYPTIPAGTCPDNPYQYSWLKLTFTTGAVTCIGIPWIKADTVQVLDTLTATITVENVTNDDIPIIVQALSSNGYPTATVTVTGSSAPAGTQTVTLKNTR